MKIFKIEATLRDTFLRRHMDRSLQFYIKKRTGLIKIASLDIMTIFLQAFISLILLIFDRFSSTGILKTSFDEKEYIENNVALYQYTRDTLETDLCTLKTKIM